MPVVIEAVPTTRPAASYAVHPVGETPAPIQNANNRSFPR